MFYIFKVGTCTSISLLVTETYASLLLSWYIILAYFVYTVLLLNRTEQNVNGCCFGYRWDRLKGHCVGMINMKK